MGKFFGTDGVRGLYGVSLTDEMAYIIGNSLPAIKKGVKVLLGRDTRTSGKQLADSICKGIKDGGGIVIDAGVIPTPTIAYTTLSVHADYGVVVSASHNPPEYNGIKIFDRMGRKLPEADKLFIEDRLTNGTRYAASGGSVEDGAHYAREYIEKVSSLIGVSFEGYTVALDCADGAASNIAPEIFTRLGAKVISFNDAGDGSVINVNKGALYPLATANKVKKLGCDVGYAFDGDADRLIACDKLGRIIDGDLIVYAIANYLKKRNRLKNMTVVGTHHTNMGVENAFRHNGITLIRTDIGDQYVAQEMIESDFILGGEQSGHIIMRDFLDTGDGIWAAAYFLKVMAEEKKAADKLVKVKKLPQININVEVNDNKAAMRNPVFVQACEEARISMNGKGRLLIRASGTEPKVRIMTECKDQKLAKCIASRLERVLRSNI